MKTLNTYKEVLHALADGKELVDIDGIHWRIYDNQLKRDGVSDHYIEAIKLPCTVKEEPEYLYEVMYKSSEGWNLSGNLCLENDINKNEFKTGRKFIIENGIPVEVK